MTKRSEMAHEESTRDPIFLFQEGRIIENSDSEAEYDCEKECWVVPETGEEFDEYELLDEGWADIYWETTGVFTTREEGKNFGITHSYRFGSEGNGVDWRVYCIALERNSVLANLLNEADK